MLFVPVREGSYTLGSSCVHVYIQSHVRKDQRGFVSKWVSKLTRGKPVWTGTWQRGNENMILWVKQEIRTMKQVEGGKSPQEDLSFPLQYHRGQTGAKNMAKNAGCLGEEGKKKQKQDYPLHNSNKKAPCLDDWPAKHSHTCWRRKKKKKNWGKKRKRKQDSHQKTQASCTSQQSIFNWCLQRTILSWSFSCLPLLFWTGPYWFLKSQSTEPDTWSVSGWWWTIICASACSSSVFAWRNSSTCRQRRTLNRYRDERGFRCSKGKNKHERTA